ncbi:hypothetical protein PybrP1_011379 [[Pythium] brassicae (nom. inval.)]|nr:hypothetical protein PybrP1_011379 [[Pythium] brassicae (nom. inval.)]
MEQKDIEALSHVRIVQMFNAVDHFAANIMLFALFCTYICGLFYGAVKIASDNFDGHLCDGTAGRYDGGRVLTMFFSIMMGDLARRLATDSAILQATTSDALNRHLINFATLVTGISIDFSFSQQMTLALLSTCPIITFASSLQIQDGTGATNFQKINEADSAAAFILVEAIGTIRTVAAFSLVNALHANYTALLDESKRADARLGVIDVVAFGFSHGVTLLNIEFLFWVRGMWVAKGTITFETMFMDHD